MRRSVLPALAVALLLCGCGSKKVCTPSGTLTGVAPPPDWREAVTDADHVKLRGIRTAFLAGLDQARKAGFGAQVAAEGRLFDPDFALDGVGLAPGAYHCREITLGSKVPERAAYIAAPARDCTIAADGQRQALTQANGPQRLEGRIYPDDSSRTIFLGTVVLSDEATALHYGRDRDRDVVAAVQRVADKRWRMTIPSPAWEAPVEIIELTPAG